MDQTELTEIKGKQLEQQENATWSHLKCHQPFRLTEIVSEQINLSLPSEMIGNKKIQIGTDLHDL